MFTNEGSDQSRELSLWRHPVDQRERFLLHEAGEALLPFLVEHHLRTGVSVERICEAASGDRRLWALALLHAELPAMVEDAAEQAARQLYGEQAGSALRFLAVQQHVRASAALASTARQIRDRLALAVQG